MIHLDSFLTPSLFLVVPPGPIAKALEHPRLPVRAADIRRRTLNHELPLPQMAPASLGTGVLMRDPIPVPFERVGLAAGDEPLAILAFGTAQGVLGVARRPSRRIPFLLHPCELRLRHCVLARPQMEHRGRPKVESLHEVRARYNAANASRASA